MGKTGLIFASTVLITLLISKGVYGTTLSFQAWEYKFPSCAQSCMDTYYIQQVAPTCGTTAKNSVETADLDCVCQHTAITDNYSNIWQNQLVSCVSSQCTSAGDVQNFEQELYDCKMIDN